VDKVNKKVVEESVSIAAHLTSLKEIREKLFKQEDIGIIRQILQMITGELHTTLDHTMVQYEQHARLGSKQQQDKGS